MSVPAHPPVDDPLSTISELLDHHAQYNPGKPIYVFPYPDISSDIMKVSFLDFSHATHRVAHWLRPNRTGDDGGVIAIVANTDALYYTALLAGASRAGLIPFPMSPRNSAPAIASMLERTNCKRILSQPAFVPLIDAARTSLPASYSLHVDLLIPLSDVYPGISHSAIDVPPPPSYPPSPKPSSPSDLVIYLHSSGSTGFPKPIPQRLFNIATFAAIADVDGKHIRGVMALPTFHFMGFISQLVFPVYNGDTVVLFPPRSPEPPVIATPENTLEVARKTNVTYILAVPVFVEAWSRNEDDVTFLAALKHLAFAGGPLPSAVSAKLFVAGVNLTTTYASTETGPVARSILRDDPALVGSPYPGPLWVRVLKHCRPRWIPEGDGSYEIQLLTCPTHKPCVENLPDGEHGYATSDLFEPHPTIPDLWRVVGRKDDVIVLSTGEKSVPLAAEGHIGGHPSISGALMFGRGREQVGLLLEPRPGHSITPGDESALVAFRDSVWPYVKEANRDLPAFSRVFKEMIIVTEPARPLPRAAKGTIVRRQALLLYEEDINAIYTLVDGSKDANGIEPPFSWVASDIQMWLEMHASSISNGTMLAPDKDLFEQGFDSLSSTFLRNRIIGALRTSPDPTAQAVHRDIQPNFVYTHPTLVSLSAAIAALVHPSSEQTSSSSATQEIERLISKYTSLLPSASSGPARTDAEDGRVVVFLTGTTGALGSHVLAGLISNARVKRIYALNRGSSLVDRQRKRFGAEQLPTALLSDTRLMFLSGDLSRDDLGLETALLEEIRGSVTHIMHCAWRVDFNLTLSFFEPYIAGAVRLLRLAPHAHFIFTSSISAVQGSRAPGAVPEAPLDDPAAAGPGYGASKYIVEHVLANAQKAGMRATSARVGQICGPARGGAWNTAEWVPGLVKSSIALGALPSSLNPIAWTPMDAVAAALVDIVLSTSEDAPPPLVNIVHPRPVPWDAIFHALNQELGRELPLVPFPDWVQRLEKVADGAGAAQLEAAPAIKLLEFYRGIASAGANGAQTFETGLAQRASPTLATLSPLGREHVAAWVRYWRSERFI